MVIAATNSLGARRVKLTAASLAFWGSDDIFRYTRHHWMGKVKLNVNVPRDFQA